MELEYPQFHFPGGERELERQHCWDCGGENDRLVRINGERSGEGDEEDCGREREEEEALKCFRRYEREVSGEGNLWHNGEKEECETEERGDREGVGRGEEGGGGGGVSREENGIRSRESEAEMCRGEEVKTGKEREDGRGGDTRRGDEEVYSGFEEKRGATCGGEEIKEQEENGEREEEEQGERDEEEHRERDEEEHREREEEEQGEREEEEQGEREEEEYREREEEDQGEREEEEQGEREEEEYREREEEDQGEREEEEQGEREEEEYREREEEEGNWKKNGECSTGEEKKNSCTDEVEEEEVEREIKREGDGRKEERRDKKQDNINGREEHDVQDKERDEEKEAEEEDGSKERDEEKEVEEEDEGKERDKEKEVEEEDEGRERDEEKEVEEEDGGKERDEEKEVEEEDEGRERDEEKEVEEEDGGKERDEEKEVEEEDEGRERDERKEVEEEDGKRQVEGEKYKKGEKERDQVECEDGREDEEECNENEEEFEDGACVAEVKGESECPECLRRPVLYCVDEQLHLCWACGLSEPHDGHRVCAPEEALQDSRVEVSISMQPIFHSLKNLKRVQETYRHMAKHLPSQSAQTERQIQDQFEELRRFLRREEETRVAAVREEQERKASALRERTERMRGELCELLHALRASQMEMETEGEDNGLRFLQNYKKTLKRVWKVNQSPEKSYDSLIDVPKHVGNLRFRVWEKMKEICPYTPVTLDPNTAGPFLLVSGDLTSVRNSGVDIDADGDILDADDNNRLPDNPERFTSCGEMLACEVISISGSAQRQPLRGRSLSLGFGFGRGCRRPASADAADSGYTSWVVDVGDNSNWTVGVGRRSVSRKSPVAACPENGRWALSLRRSCYEASESPAAPLPLSFCGERGRSRLQGPADTAPGLRRVKVRVSHGSGRVCFTDADRHTHLYTFSHTAARESLQPYFSTACHRRYPLRVLPASVTVTTSRQGPGGEDEEEEEEDEEE